MKSIQISSKNFWKKSEKCHKHAKKKINKKKNLWILCIFFNFFFTKGFFIDFNETWNDVKFIMHYQCICKTQKNEIYININLLKTNWNQNLTARSASAPPPHHNAAQAARHPLLPPESTSPSTSVEPAAASHRDESERENQKIQTWFFVNHDIQMFNIISN